MPNIDESYFQSPQDPIKQNKVEDILTDGERILFRTKPDKRDYILEAVFKSLPFVALWVTIDVFVIIMTFNNVAFQQSGFPAIFLIGFFALHLIPLWLYIANIVKRVAGYKNTEYVFTDKRVIARSGVIGIGFRFFYFPQVDSVTVSVGLWDRIFKVGDIHIKSASEQIILEDVHDPYGLSAKLQKIVQDTKTDMVYPNDLRPKTNHGYRTEYTPTDEQK